MKITENLSRDADSILSIELLDDERVGDDSNRFFKKANVVFKEDASIHIFYDTDEGCGYGFCENLKAKIDAYFEAKENAVLHQERFLEEAKKIQDILCTDTKLIQNKLLKENHE
jgi:hypothetical protein